MAERRSYCYQGTPRVVVRSEEHGRQYGRPVAAKPSGYVRARVEEQQRRVDVSLSSRREERCESGLAPLVHLAKKKTSSGFSAMPEF